MELENDAPPALRPVAEAAFEAVERELGTGFAPGAAAALVDADGDVAAAWGGAAVLSPRIPVARDTVFDLASLTKQVVTAPLASLLAAEGRWSLDDRLGRWLEGYGHPVTLRQCLTHTSGLVPHLPLWQLASTRAGMRDAVFAAPPGDQTRIVYSDLNYILLGWAIESCAGRPLDELAAERLFRPLGMARTLYLPPESIRDRLAASEIWGEVHDENCRALGGVTGHAGLFSTLDDLARYSAAMLRPGAHPALPEAAIGEMLRPQASDPPEERGLGWRLHPWEQLAGWPEDAFGHTGFTGTSLVMSRSAGVAAVLLTNATHPRRRPEGAAAVRRAFHAAIARRLPFRENPDVEA
ncbi:MAG TPA: serine hydrolase domain-containing protein [Candidatus Dormibacteraeota bacterium]|jgi:CubicO group peptidase (beta-lactamase class C family)|nr:serine hydrolase domain-containing protein [Candidatus Dormibacteraeota bacterium]